MGDSFESINKGGGRRGGGGARSGNSQLNFVDLKNILHATRRTPHGASRLVQAMSAWLAKTKRAPSLHSRDARVYGHTTTAMYTTPSLSPCSNYQNRPHPIGGRGGGGGGDG